MTSSISARRAPVPFSPSQPPDEDYLNKSLLDNIDAQGDAEPLSSDSETAGASASTFGSIPTASSIGSPSIPYHISMQSQLGPPRADSPNHHVLASHHKSAQHSTDLFSTGSQNNTNHSMYNSMNGIGLPPPDFSLPSAEADALNFPSNLNGYGAGPFRTSTSFSLPNRSRHPNSYRDTSTSYSSAYPSSNDLFGPSQNPMSHLQGSQPQHPQQHSIDPMQLTARPFDYAPGGSQLNGATNGSSQAKQLFGNGDPFQQSAEPLLQSRTLQVLAKQQGGAGGTQSLLPNGSHSQPPYQTSYGNGLGGHSVVHGLHTQPQFGPPLPGNGAGPGQGGAQSGGVAGAPSMNHTNGPTPGSQAQEEISTIFVVGFPDDMSVRNRPLPRPCDRSRSHYYFCYQEREFQNMFTFSSGFEAATLKIPNKESTSYGNVNGQAGRPQGLTMPFGGSSDPYNHLTMNQGGVLIDGGRDGPMTSWPASAPNDDSHFMQNNMPMQPPRKQIIGFAKFRTREQALEARDVLQGRRVDVEKGAVLKAEMAKKNLHTKRGPGVGPLGLPPFAGGVPGASGADNLNTLSGLPAAGEAFSQRDKQLGALGAMGIDFSGFNQRRDRLFEGRDEEDRDRRRGEFALSPGMFSTRGPRERAEEDERERKRKEKEATRLRQQSFAYDAFHSVPQQMVRQGANSLVSAENGMTPNGLSMPSSPPSLHSIPSQSEGLAGLWGTNLRDVSAAAHLRKMGVPQHHLSGLPPRPQSPDAVSPPAGDGGAFSSAPGSASSQTGHSAPGSAQFTPESALSSLPSHPSLPLRPSAAASDDEHGDVYASDAMRRVPVPPFVPPQRAERVRSSLSTSSLPGSKEASVSGSQSGHEHEDDLAQCVGALAVSTESGATSPQLPSPASGTSSGGARSGSDHNPPINTLYVGNLPTSTSPGGHTLGHLEGQLRELFTQQQGFRKLCFRQKSNSPMCFVEVCLS